MAFCVRRGTVCLFEWVDYVKVPGQLEIPWFLRVLERLTVRASRCATVCVVSKLVNVHTSLSIGIMASDVP